MPRRIPQSILAALFSGAVLCGLASAQRLPDPPALPPAPSEMPPDLDRFRAAYQRAESPNIAILVERSAPAGAKPDVGEGAFVSLYDTTGDTYLLKVSIEEFLRKVPETEIVNVAAIRDIDKRDVELLKLSDEQDAIRLLGKKVNADIMLVIRMQRTGQHGAAYRCTVETIDTTRGRTLDAFGFDWLENTDAATIKGTYAPAIVRKFIDGFDRAFGVNTTAGAARKFTLKLIGVNTEQLKAAKDAFTAIPGVVAPVKVGQRQASSRNGKDESVSELTINYVGAAFDLSYELQSAAKRALNMEIRDTDLTAGAITLIARAARKAEEGPSGERWVTLSQDSKDGDRARENLQNLYHQKGSPRIALFINRALTEDELKDPAIQAQLPADKPVVGGGSTGPVYINIVGDVINRAPGQGAGGGANHAPGGAGELGTDQLDTERIENELLRRFNTKFGFTMIDPRTARSSLMKQSEKARRVMEENELVYLLKQQSVAEVVVLGVGRIERYGGKNTPVYTFRAVRLSDAAVLASANVTTDQFDFFRDAERMREAIEGVSREAAAKLADGMWIKWQPPTPLKVQVQNAKTALDLLRIRDVLRDSIPGLRRIESRQFEAGKDGGVGVFDAEYTCTYDELVKAFIDAQAKLPFALDQSASTQETLTIRIRDTQ